MLAAPSFTFASATGTPLMSVVVTLGVGDGGGIGDVVIASVANLAPAANLATCSRTARFTSVCRSTVVTLRTVPLFTALDGAVVVLGGGCGVGALYLAKKPGSAAQQTFSTACSSSGSTGTSDSQYSQVGNECTYLRCEKLHTLKTLLFLIEMQASSILSDSSHVGQSISR